MNTPLIIAICGLPKSGKSTLQDILHRKYNVRPWDDGSILRQHMQRISGLNIEEFATQEGKKRQSIIGSVLWEHRKALGEYGNLLEAMFGENIIPEIACREIQQHFQESRDIRTLHSIERGVYSCASVRRKQGVTYKKYGGIVVEVIRPGVEPTGNEFDEYDQSLVDVTLLNKGNTVEEFERQIEKSALPEMIAQTDIQHKRSAA
jgi:hypothetical protein